MGLTSSVPANATAGQFPAMYQAPQSTSPATTYTDKKYVDDHFVPVTRFNDFHTNYRDNVTNEGKPGSWAFAKAGAPSNKLSDYVFNDNLSAAMKTQLETAGSPARTGFNTVFDAEFPSNFTESLATPGYQTDYNNKLTAAGYNPLTNYYVKEDNGGKLCHYAKSNNQRELCVDTNGKLYLQGLGLKVNETDSGTDSDVYSYILTQNNAYWTARGNLSYSNQYVYSPTQGIVLSSTVTVNATSANASVTTVAPTLASSSAMANLGSQVSSTTHPTMFTYSLVWTATVPFSGFNTNSNAGFLNPPTTINLSLPTTSTYLQLAFTIPSKTATNFTYRITGTYVQYSTKSYTAGMSADTLTTSLSPFTFTYQAIA
jgi:hypothetical protein